MITVAEAQDRLLSGLPQTGMETVSLSAAAGRVLAEPVVARRSQPPADVSAMDGYAVRAADIASPSSRLTVLEEIAAGTMPTRAVEPGTAARIFTGAVVPEGADSVVIQENTAREGDTIVIKEVVEPYRHIRRAGGDFRQGDMCLAAGHRVGVRDIALLAAMNIPWITVRRRPRIALLANGDELVNPGDQPAPGQIVAANSPALAAAVALWGGEALDLGIIPDDLAALTRALTDLNGIDMIVSSGGASVGDHDLIQEALRASGFTLDFWRIAMRPGKPLMVARRDHVTLLGLPGNPVSALVCALLFLRPALGRLSGADFPPPVLRQLPLAAPLPEVGQRQDYLRAVIEHDGDEERVRPAALQDSSMLTTASRSDCLILRPPGAAAAGIGDPVSVILLDKPVALAF